MSFTLYKMVSLSLSELNFPSKGESLYIRISQYSYSYKTKG